MFEDIEEFGYERDLVIEEETPNDYPAQNFYPPDQFFPNDDGKFHTSTGFLISQAYFVDFFCSLDLNDEPIIETAPKRFKPRLYDDPSALDWYLRVNLDDECDKTSIKCRENEKLITDAIKRVQQYKSGGVISGEKSKSDDFSLLTGMKLVQNIKLA